MCTIEHLIGTAEFGDHFRQHVIDKLRVLLVDLIEEDVCEVLQLRIAILEENGDATHFTLQLYHIVED